MYALSFGEHVDGHAGWWVGWPAKSLSLTKLLFRWSPCDVGWVGSKKLRKHLLLDGTFI